MKKHILLLLILAACVQTPIEPTQNNTDTITLEDVVKEFTEIDKELNTSWHEEEVPINMIRLNAIEPWTAQTLFLKDRIAQTGSQNAADLIEARIAMLKTQTAYYLLAKHKTGILKTTGEKRDIKLAEEINCDKKDEIIEASRILFESFDSWKDFNHYMDSVLQTPEGKKLIGVDENKPKLYDAPFRDAYTYLTLVEKEIKKCGIELKFDFDVPENYEDLLYGEEES